MTILRTCFGASVVLIVLLMMTSGCDKKFDASQLLNTGPATGIGDTNYSEIQPPWGGFENPVAVVVGNDNLIYVADNGLNEVIMMDAGGTVLNRRKVPNPVSIAQNATLDLYIGGVTLAPNGIDTIGALYKLFLVRYDTTYVDTLTDSLTGTKTFVHHDSSTFFDHRIDVAPMRIVRKEAGYPQRRFVGIGILPDNQYLVARVGPDNSSFVDPDTRVLMFTKGDTLITPVPELQTGCGTAINDINQVTGLAVFRGSKDYILTQSNQCTAYGAIWMTYQITGDFGGWVAKYDPANAAQQSKDFIQPNRFVAAAGVAIDPRRSDVFIVDSYLDSVVKFDRNGNFKRESFGRYRTVSNILPGLNHPRSVASSTDCTLYVADTGNKVIRRFKLASQSGCP